MHLAGVLRTFVSVSVGVCSNRRAEKSPRQSGLVIKAIRESFYINRLNGCVPLFPDLAFPTKVTVVVVAQ